MMFLNKLKIYFFKYDLLAVFLLTLSIKLIFLLFTGLGPGGDTPFYIDIAKKIVGLPNTAEHFPLYYTGYPLFKAVLMRFFGQAHIVLITLIAQIILSAVSCIFLFRTLLIFTSHRIMAFILTLIYCLNFEVLNWDRYILTDSFSLSLLVITTYFILTFMNDRLGARSIFSNIPIILLLFVCLFFTRPTNVVFIFISTLFILYHFCTVFTIKIRLAICLLTLSLLVISFFGVYQKMNLIEEITHVVVSRMITGQVIDDLSILDDVPRNFEWSSASFSTQAMFLLHVFLKRMLYFWAVTMPRYSIGHKLFNLLWLLPIWIAGAVGIISALLKKRTVLTLFPIALIIGYNVFQALIMIDFDFRYRIVTIPSIFIMICILINFFLSNRLKKNLHLL